MPEITLLPCPFCGGTDLTIATNDFDIPYIRCSCLAEGPLPYDGSDGTSLWNTRESEKLLQERINQLEGPEEFNHGRQWNTRIAEGIAEENKELKAEIERLHKYQHTCSDLCAELDRVTLGWIQCKSIEEMNSRVKIARDVLKKARGEK